MPATTAAPKTPGMHLQATAPQSTGAPQTPAPHTPAGGEQTLLPQTPTEGMSTAHQKRSKGQSDRGSDDPTAMSTAAAPSSSASASASASAQQQQQMQQQPEHDTGHGVSRKHEAAVAEGSPKKQRMADDEVVRMYKETSHPKRSAEEQAPEGEADMKRVEGCMKAPQMVMKMKKVTL